MANDMFIKIGNIKGESKDDKHKDEIDVLAWSWGMSQSGSMHTGGGGGAGRVNVQDLNLTKYVDAATPILMQFCATGTHVDEVVLTLRKAGGDQMEYLKLTLKKAIITNVSTGGSGGEDKLTENITINFAEYSIGYKPQDDKGAAGAAITHGYNIEKNVVV